MRKLILSNDIGKVYLIRWTLVSIPLIGWQIKLHKILSSDDDVCVHDHPWWFWRIVLRGSYYERTQNGERIVSGFLPQFCPSGFRHRISRLAGENPVWTLLLTGKNKGDWGFYTKQGYVSYREYSKAGAAERVGWCEENDLEL